MNTAAALLLLFYTAPPPCLAAATPLPPSGQARVEQLHKRPGMAAHPFEARCCAATSACQASAAPSGCFAWCRYTARHQRWFYGDGCYAYRDLCPQCFRIDAAMPCVRPLRSVARALSPASPRAHDACAYVFVCTSGFLGIGYAPHGIMRVAAAHCRAATPRW